MAICVAILAGLATLVLLFKLFFGQVESFQDWLNEVFLPSVTWLAGDVDLLTQVKVAAWQLSGFLVGLAAYAGFRMLFG